MSGKHTPGPWSVIFYDAGDCDHHDRAGPCPGIFAPEEHDCAVVHWDGFKQEYWVSANGDQRQIEANARLIAAAPELLEALRALRNHCSGKPKPNTLLALLEKAHAAIQKATGGQGT